MGARDAQGIIDGAPRRFIRRMAWELAHNSAFTLDERQDLEQELTLDLLVRLARFDPRRGTRAAFVRLVVSNHAGVLLERRLAECRDPGRVAFSLDDAFEDDEGGKASKSEAVGVEDLAASWRPVAEDHDLRVDLARVIYRLPPDLADLALRLATQGVTEISESTGIPRGTLYDALKRIRRAFEDAGLRDYLGGRRFRRESGT